MAPRNFRIFLLTGVSTLMLPQLAHAQMLTGYDEGGQPVEVASYQPQEKVQPFMTYDDVGEPPVEVTPAPLDDVQDMKRTPSLTTYDPEYQKQEDPVNLDADNLVHNEKEQTIVASGNVFLMQAGRILRADQITYNLATDTAYADGHVVLSEENGDIHYSEHVEFNDKLKNGLVDQLKVYMADGSRFTAREGRREDGIRTKMQAATYTPCEPCKKNPDKPPLWGLRAAEVTHDESKHQISYKHARFEVKGVPIVYVPYFAHPDGTIKQKSGLLAPSGGFKSDLGFFVENKYYWAIAPDQDATIGLFAFTDETPLLTGEWRKRWQNASVWIDGGITDSSRTDNSNGVNVDKGDEVRGHVMGEGRWDINEKWRSGVNIAWASDDQYMRQYDFTNEDVLENEIYAERFSGRNYAAGRLLTFQDVRVRENQEDQPQVLPEIVASFKGEPNSIPVFGGRWGIDASFLGLQREGSDQDLNRFSLSAGWNRRLVSDYGLVTTADLNVRGDLYNTRDRIVATPTSGLDDNETAARIFPQMHLQSSYPVAKSMEKMQITIEPIAALTLSPNMNINDDIPNEDSLDVQADASNIFEPDRFPGLDRIEDQSRVTYGVRTGVNGYNGARGDVFLGQSHRLQEDDNPFPAGSGLDQQNSDIVGQVTAEAHNFSLDYRFQLNSDTFASERHEVDAYLAEGKFSTYLRYLYANSLDGTDIDESREQLYGSVGYYFNPRWQVRVGATQDLGEAPGLRQAIVGLDHFGQCISWSLNGVRNLTDDSSGESDTEIVFRIGLKNLGGFERSDLRPDGTRY